MHVHPYLDADGPIALAHRGGAEAATENSMEAFEDAVQLGYRYLETDCHATADGVLVAFHDVELDRVTNHSGAIAEMDWARLARVRMKKGERIVRLDELLGTWNHVRFNIDPKSDEAAALLPKCLREMGIGLDRVCFGSFSNTRLSYLRRAVPGVCTSMGPREVARLRAQSWGVPRVLGPFRAKCVQVPVRQGLLPVADQRFIAKANALGLPVHVWTINDAFEMRRLLDAGARGIVTDRPRVLKSLLQERNQWS
ncbi:MAG: glycerophosphodiester phosphodiesterase [Myxococcota bacterium]